MEEFNVLMKKVIGKIYYHDLTTKFYLLFENNKCKSFDNLLTEIQKNQKQRKSFCLDSDLLNLDITELSKDNYEVEYVLPNTQYFIFNIFKGVKIKDELNGKEFTVYNLDQVNFIQNVLYSNQISFKNDQNEIIPIDKIKGSGSTIYIKNNIMKENMIEQLNPSLGGVIKLSNLTLNSFIYNNKDGVYLEDEQRTKFIKEIADFFKNKNTEDNYREYCGKHGIGKTISFLKLRYDLKDEKWFHPWVLYLNLKSLYMKQNTLLDIFNIVSNELKILFKYTFEGYTDFFNRYLTKFQNLSNYKYKNIYRNTLILEVIQNLVEYNEENIYSIFVILDQYKNYEDNSPISFLKLLKSLASKNKLKFIICSSVNEKSVRDGLNDYFFQQKKNFYYLPNLVNCKTDNLKQYQKDVFEKLGNLPAFYDEIINLKEKEVDLYLDNKFSYYEKKITKVYIHDLKMNDTMILALLKIIIHHDEVLTFEQFKENFKYLTAKFLQFNSYDNNNKFSFSYGIPLIEEVIHSLIKKKKKENLEACLSFCNEIEKGYILEYFTYFAFDKGCKPFEDKNEIKNSYLVDKVKYFNTLYLEYNNKTKSVIEKIPQTSKQFYLIMDKNSQELIDTIIEPKNIYHFRQKYINGQTYDGALLIPIDSRTNERNFELIVYQTTNHRNPNEYINRNQILEDKDYLSNHFSNIFKISIEKISFFYVLLWENPDTSLIKFCNDATEQLSYIFYSFKEHKLKLENNTKFELKNICRREIFPISEFYLKFFHLYDGQETKNQKDIIFELGKKNYFIDSKTNMLKLKRKREDSESLNIEKDFNIKRIKYISYPKEYNLIPKDVIKTEIKNYFDENEKAVKNFNKAVSILIKTQKVKLEEKANNIKKFKISKSQIKLEKADINEENDFNFDKKNNQYNFKIEESLFLKEHFMKNIYAGISDININIIKRAFFYLLMDLPELPLFIVLYEKEKRKKYVIYYSKKTNVVILDLHSKKQIDNNYLINLYGILRNDSKNYSEKYSTYFCALFT